jgi:hypothetical protein
MTFSLSLSREEIARRVDPKMFRLFDDLPPGNQPPATMVPWLAEAFTKADEIMAYINKTARAAAGQTTGRQSGRTTDQILNAPHGALFVWCNSTRAYPRDLARTLGRTDLSIVGPQWLNSDQWQGCRFSGIVVDHAAHLTSLQSATVNRIKQRIATVAHAETWRDNTP